MAHKPSNRTPRLAAVRRPRWPAPEDVVGAAKLRGSSPGGKASGEANVRDRLSKRG